jgi:phage shock protein A
VAKASADPKNTIQNDRDAALERELGQLKQQYEKLREAKVRTEQNLANLEEQLAELETQARGEYGSADPAELERLLAEKRAENERLVSEYRAHIQSVQSGLQSVEQGEAE